MATNQTIAAAFEEYATLLELKGENPFKARAYSMAARTIGCLMSLARSARSSSEYLTM